MDRRAQLKILNKLPLGKDPSIVLLFIATNWIYCDKPCEWFDSKQELSLDNVIVMWLQSLPLDNNVTWHYTDVSLDHHEEKPLDDVSHATFSEMS